MPSSRGSSWPRDWTHISYFCIGRLKQQCYPIRWETNRDIYTSTPVHQELKTTPGHVASHSGHWESKQREFWKPEKKKKSSVNKQKMQLLSVASRTTNLKSWGWKGPQKGGPSKACSIALFHNSMIRFISFPFYFPKSLIFLNFSKIAPYSFPELNPWRF